MCEAVSPAGYSPAGYSPAGYAPVGGGTPSPIGGGTHRPRLTLPRALPARFAVLTMLAQVAYPLAHGAVRDRLTIAIVLLFAAASVGHAWMSRGSRTAALLVAVTTLAGFAAEVLGVHTGVPFGRYAYSGTLGVRVLGVPVVIALAWTMFAWPCALVARRLVSSMPARVAVGAWALASWDLFLDPQMVAAGHWRWRYPSPHLPGIPAVPLTNFAGWLLVAVLISLVLQGVLRSSPVSAEGDAWPCALFVWTWASSMLALGAFLHLGGAALWGGVAMGLVALPLLREVAR